MRRGLIAAIDGIAVAAAITAGVAAWQPSAGPAGISDGVSANDTISVDKSWTDPFTPIPDSNLPRLSDPSLKSKRWWRACRHQPA